MPKPLNLIPAPRLAARQRRVWRGRCAVVCAGYAAVVAAVTVAGRAVVVQTDASLPSRLDDAAADVRRTEDVLAGVRAELDGTEALLRSSRAIAEQPDWSALLGLLAARAGDRVVLKGLAVRPKDPPPAAAPAPRAAGGKPAKPPGAPDPTVLVSISGAGPSQAAASDYALRLEATGLFGRVSLLDTNREAFGDLSLVSFRIECTLGEPAAAAGRPPVAGAPVANTPAARGLAAGGEP